MTLSCTLVPSVIETRGLQAQLSNERASKTLPEDRLLKGRRYLALPKKNNKKIINRGDTMRTGLPIRMRRIKPCPTAAEPQPCHLM